MSGNESQGWLYGKKRFWVNFWFCSTSKLLINLNFFAMERKFFLMIALVCAIATFTSCQYDDGDLWKKVNSLEEQVDANKEDIATLTSLIEALNKGKMIVTTTPTANGYTLTFSDGSTIEITNGSDGDSMFVSIEEQDDVVIITLSDGRVITLPVISYELRVLSFDDEEGDDYWSSLISSTPYGSGNNKYSWYDENTGLLFYPDRCSMMGGHAVSNYTGNDLSLPVSSYYNIDLQAYNVTGGANGTKNFCVHFGYLDDSDFAMQDHLMGFEFDDGVARTIDHMYVTNTTYVYHCLAVGDQWMVPAGGVPNDCWMKIIAYGYDDIDAEDDEYVTSTEFYLLKENRDFVTNWTKWNLSSLGDVVKVRFNMEGSSYFYEDHLGGNFAHGFLAPAYFAYDDVAVRFEK